MIVRHKVADFNNWKKVFDEFTETRRGHGWVSHDILRDNSDPNFVTIVDRAKSLDGLMAYGSSQGLKDAMHRAGVISAPEISIMNDDEHFSY